MGLRDRLRKDDNSDVRRYRMREQLLSIGDDYWIEDETGRRAFKVDGKAVRVRDTFVLRDVSGQEAAKIQERKARVRQTMEIEQPSGNATVHKALVGVRDRFKIDVDGGHDLSAHGNLVDHEYEIDDDGDTVATVSKKWFRFRDTYGVEILPGQDEVRILAITVCIDALTRD
ncbi:LURP-one-related family protein [Pseudonocardia sp. NPDC049154]|uniref:LURP-one-related/scramblase family protein n=1 Tax=Pseudonocardia sp. NPDC049154 TaxID=3155501 RepID=UPI00340EFA9A